MSTNDIDEARSASNRRQEIEQEKIAARIEDFKKEKLREFGEDPAEMIEWLEDDEVTQIAIEALESPHGYAEEYTDLCADRAAASDYEDEFE